MKKLLLTAAALMMTAILSLAGCKKDDYSPDDENTDKVTINPEYVPIDWETTTVTNSDDSTGNYTIRFADSVPDIHPGSVIAIDRDTVVLYRFVLTANKSGNTMSLTTTEAGLTDIFYDSEFTFTTESSSKSTYRGVVFLPVAAYMTDGNGGYIKVDLVARGKDDTHFTHNLWNQPLFNLDGQVLTQGDHYKLWLEKMNASMGVDLVMFMNFGGRDTLEIVLDGIRRYRSKALEVEAKLVGNFDTEQKIRFDAEGNFACTPDYDLWKHNIFKPLPIRFMAGPVPVVLTLRCDLFRQVEASGSGEISAYTGFTDHAEINAGFNWKQTSGIEPIGNFQNAFNYTPPTVEGKGQIQAKVWVFPRVKVMLYDLVGPSFDIMPWLSDTIRGGFREQTLGQTNDYCAWSLDCHAGLDYRFGLSVNHPFFGYEVANYPTDRRTWIDQKLYHSPKKVVHASGRPQGGQTATVRFDVFDTSYITHSTFKTILPQIVKFEASGDLSSEYGIAHSGTVQVSWTPNSRDTLWAKLYDQDGNVLSFDTVIVWCDCNLTSGDWVDLGLPSGLLWATRNVGASSPTDYGNHYAWGEISPKSVYDWSTYRYLNSSTGRLTKYTSSDGLTTLQPSDDAAAANYGGRTPTSAEWQELTNNTTSRWITINGVSGRCFTGSNGNSLFLPAAGDRWEGSPYTVGSYGSYWSSSLYTGNPNYAWDYYFNSVGVYWSNDNNRSDGHTVRAVRQP